MTTMTTTTTTSTSNPTALATFAASIDQNGRLMAASGDDYLKALAWLASAPLGFFDFAHSHPQASKDLVNSLKAANLAPSVYQFLARIPAAVWNEILTKATADHDHVANVRKAACGDADAKDKSKATWIAILRGIQFFVTADLAVIDAAALGFDAILLSAAGILAGVAFPAAAALVLVAMSVFVAALLATIVLGGVDLALEIVVLVLG